VPSLRHGFAVYNDVIRTAFVESKKSIAIFSIKIKIRGVL